MANAVTTEHETSDAWLNWPRFGDERVTAKLNFSKQM